MLNRMFGKPKKDQITKTELSKATDVLQERIDQLDTQARALHDVTDALGEQVRRLNSLDPNDCRIRHIFGEYKASSRQCADIAAARSSMARKLHALKTKAMAIENMETLSNVQRTLGNKVAPGVLDQLDDAMESLQLDADEANEISDAFEANLDDDEVGLAAFLGRSEPEIKPLETLPEINLPHPKHTTSGTEEAASWLVEG